MGKTMVAVFFGLVMVVAGVSGAYALQRVAWKSATSRPGLSWASRSRWKWMRLSMLWKSGT
ncbi:MAG: hypothetical protein U0361_15570 [Nitrospiraceae bacterium]